LRGLTTREAGDVLDTSHTTVRRRAEAARHHPKGDRLSFKVGDRVRVRMKGHILALPEGYEIAGYRRSHYEYDERGRPRAHVVDLAANELVVEQSGQLYDGPKFQVGLSRNEQSFLIVRQPGRFVQVRISGARTVSRTPYTYRDPRGRSRSEIV
jgi:hypothetical protein